MADYNSYRRNRPYGNNRDWDQLREQNSSGNIYGGDTRNYGNANQGGYDRNWWDRTIDKVSSWLGGDESERNRGMNRHHAGGQRGKGPKGYVRSENRIREDVYERLTEDDRLDATNIEVQVQGDTVILSGTTQSKEEKRRAEDLVERITGVRNVENRIHIDNSMASGFSERYQY